MLLTATFFVLGLGLLLYGAEVLVRGASRLAANLGVSPLIIGLTVVAYATGSPELAVSIQSARVGQTEIALGNIVGSNIFNVLFILGISAAIVPLVVSSRLVKLEVPLMIISSAALFGMARDGRITRVEGVILLGATVVYTLFVVYQTRRSHRPGQTEATAKGLKQPAGGKWAFDLIRIGVGLVMLILGARWLVAGAVMFAKHLGISNELIALTIIAAGTGLPEVATSVVAGLRGQRDIAVGNVVGSNIFNVLAVGGTAAVVAPGGILVTPQILSYDLPIMLATAVACFPVLYGGAQVARWEGFLFLAYYVAYTTFLVLKATGHSSLPLFQTAMLGFVIPITVLTLSVTLGRSLWHRWRDARPFFPPDN